MRFLPTWLPLFGLLLIGTPSELVSAEIHDNAGMFGDDAVREAQSSLDRLESEFGVPIVIETIDSLQGETIEAVSLRRARQSDRKGIYILMARDERQMEVRDYQSFLGSARRQTILDTFLTSFKKDEFDEGLTRGIAAIEPVLAEVKARSEARQANAPPVNVLREGNPHRANRGFPAPAPRRRTPGVGFVFMIGVFIVGGLIAVIKSIGADDPKRRRRSRSGTTFFGGGSGTSSSGSSGSSGGGSSSSSGGGGWGGSSGGW